VARKDITQTTDPGVHGALDAISKNGLADLVIDLVRRCEGNEALEGRALVLAIAQAYAPLAKVRGDRVPTYFEGRPEVTLSVARKGEG
jgi:hypothetical protein